MIDVLIDSLLDSAKVFAVVFVIYIAIAYFEEKIAHIITKKNKLSPLFASMFGIIPQCGLNVVASDLYLKHHITVGTLIALFLASSDEALPILIASPKAISAFYVILVKIVIGFLIGFIVDAVHTHEQEEIHHHLEECHHDLDEPIEGCCHHVINEDKTHTKINKYLLHPLIHSLKLFAYVFVIYFVFGTIMYYIGEDTFVSFLQKNKYLAPLISVLIGVIPSCASSVIITESFVLNGIGLGALIGGLSVNSGLGFMYLLKNKKNRKGTFQILAILMGVSIVIAYLVSFIVGF